MSGVAVTGTSGAGGEADSNQSHKVVPVASSGGPRLSKKQRKQLKAQQRDHFKQQHQQPPPPRKGGHASQTDGSGDRPATGRALASPTMSLEELRSQRPMLAGSFMASLAACEVTDAVGVAAKEALRQLQQDRLRALIGLCVHPTDQVHLSTT